MENHPHAPNDAGAMTPELQEELRLARRCFTNIERLSTLMAGYPPGHPVVEAAIEGVHAAFYEFFELNDRLTLQVHPHWMVLYGTDQVVWETDDPRDYCFALSRDGIYLIHILAGVDVAELRRLVEVFNELVDQRDMTRDAVTLLFEASFRYISYDAIDESLATLAGLDDDRRDRDTREEQELVEELFHDAFDKGVQEQVDRAPSAASSGDFDIRLKHRAESQQRLEVGSRQFLELSPESQRHLLELRRGFTEHAELEHREGEMLSAILGARPKEALRHQTIAQIGEVMGVMLETQQPWEALSFLKIIHQWRDRFGPEVADELKNIVKSCFTPRRIQTMVKNINICDRTGRRAILQMFNALHLDEATAALVGLLAWELEDEVREDVLRYIRERARHGLGFLEESLFEVSAAQAEPLFEIIVAQMPRSRPLLCKVVTAQVEPAFKVRALKALAGTWKDAIEVRDMLLPLLESSSSEVRMLALQSVAQATPQHVVRVVAPMFTDKLRRYPEDEVRQMVNIFVVHGQQEAVERLKTLVHRRGLINDDDQELAVTIIRALVRTPHPSVVSMLDAVARDWLVNGRIRSTCKEVVDLLQAGNVQ